MTMNLSKPIKALAVSAAIGFLASCASLGPSDNPIVRKFSWLSYLEGGDIRTACAQGAPDTYRLVYNGVYTEQVRMYDLQSDGSLRIQVLGPADLRTLSVQKTVDLLTPWNGRTIWMQLDPAEVSDIVTALDQDGVFGTPAVGTELSSKGFFWTAAACHEGRYSFTAWMWPSPTWDGLRFDDVLLALDPSPTKINPPRKTELRRAGIVGYNNSNENAFWTKVGENGLVGVMDVKN